MERLVVQVAPGKFDVIEGVKLNDEPLTRAEADRLAHENADSSVGKLSAPVALSQPKRGAAFFGQPVSWGSTRFLGVSPAANS
jgi:hypothetical protein